MHIIYRVKEEWMMVERGLLYYYLIHLIAHV